MVSTQKTGLMALIMLGALFSSANSFGGNDNSFDWPTARYYTGAAIGGAIAPAMIISTTFGQSMNRSGVFALMCVPPTITRMLKGNFKPTRDQGVNAQFIRGTSCALTAGALVGKVPNVPYARPAKLAAMLVSGFCAGILPS
jgi:hypothetical protein